jgi:hypothetical protein
MFIKHFYCRHECKSFFLKKAFAVGNCKVLSAHIFTVFGGKSVEYRSHWHMRYKVPNASTTISVFP